MSLSPKKREELRVEFHGRVGDARLAAERIQLATQAVRRLEAAMQEAFHLVRDAESASAEAGIQIRIEMLPEVGDAFRSWLDRPDVVRRPLGDPTENIPAFLREAS